jgi:hypothetical protein
MTSVINFFSIAKRDNTGLEELVFIFPEIETMALREQRETLLNIMGEALVQRGWEQLFMQLDQDLSGGWG